MAFKILHIDHIGIGVSDLAAVKDIFADKLGMFINRKTKSSNPKKLKSASSPAATLNWSFWSRLLLMARSPKQSKKMAAKTWYNTLPCGLTTSKRRLPI